MAELYDQDGAAGTVEELARIVEQSRTARPQVQIVLRADSGFCRESIMAWCEANRVDFIPGLAKNSRLQAILAPEMAQAQHAYEATQEPARVLKDFHYQVCRSHLHP